MYKCPLLETPFMWWYGDVCLMMLDDTSPPKYPDIVGRFWFIKYRKLNLKQISSFYALSYINKLLCAMIFMNNK